MDVTIIIPVYNVEKYISDCLHSVMNQTAGCDIECLIVDDASPDGSIKIAHEDIAAYKGRIDFRIITLPENRGLSEARNAGIREAKGDYVFFLDSDDKISDDCIARLYGLVRKHPGVEIVYGPSTCTVETKQLKQFFDLHRIKAKEFDDNPASVPKVTLLAPEVAWNKLIKREWLLSNGLFFKTFVHEDLHWHLCAFPQIASYACVLDGTPTYIYRSRADSIMGKTDESTKLANLGHLILDVSKRDLPWDSAYQIFFLRLVLKFRKLAAKDPQHRPVFKEIISNLLGKRNISPLSKSIIRYVDSRFFNPYVYYLIRSFV